MIGAEYKTGPHKLMADVQHFSGDLANNSAKEFKRTVYAVGYEYSFAKKVIGYTALNFSDASGSATKHTTSAEALDTWQAFFGALLALLRRAIFGSMARDFLCSQIRDILLCGHT